MFDKKKKDKKNIPYIARVNIAEEMKKREENMELREVSILAAADYTKKFPRIRLMYVRLEKFNRTGDGNKVGASFGVSSPFIIPKGMKIEDACKIISYLSLKVERENNIEPASEDSVALVSKLLEDYYFDKCEGKSKPGHYHSVSEYHPLSKVRTIFDEQIEGVTDLMTIDGDDKLFKKSVLSKRYFDWFSENVSEEEIKDIYYQAYLSLPDDLKSKTR